MFDLEKEVAKWLKNFSKHRAFDEGSLREMELHLRDSIDDLIGQGKNEKQAFEQAVAEFGDVLPVAEEEFANQRRGVSIRSILFATMLRNYFKTSLRTLMKNPMTSLINICGLAVAIGACLVSYAFVDFEYSIDRFHEFKDEVYLTTFYVDREGTLEHYGNTPAPIGQLLREDFSNIEKVCRIQDSEVVVRYEDQVFHERVRYVDPEFLDMFTFPLKWGVRGSLQGVNNVILNEEIANKYFGDQNPIGLDLKIIFNQEVSKTFKIAGVAQKFPDARIIDFDFLLNFENATYADPSYHLHDWNEMVNATFVQVKDPANLFAIRKGMDKYKTLQHAVDNDWPIRSFDFVSLHDLHLSSDEIRSDISYDGSDVGRVAMPIIASFILILACFNYINIAIVSAAKRLKEIGLRKVIGASKPLIVLQFLSENIFITLFAGGIGFFLASTIFLPWFASFSGISESLNLLDSSLWIFLGTVLVSTGIISGIYPAFYIAKFEVVKIFKGTVQFGKKNTLTKIFLAVQLMLACVGIAFAVMWTQNSNHQRDREWGYNQEEALYVRLPEPSSFSQLKDKLVQSPNIQAVSGSTHHLGKDALETIIDLPDRQYEVHELAVAATYFNTMGLQLVDGRFLEESRESDHMSVVVNELFVDNLTLEDPIGQTFKIDSSQYTVVGVVKNFHFNNFYYENRPTIFTLASDESLHFLSLSVVSGSQSKVHDLLRAEWAALFPDTPFNGGFQEDVWAGFYDDLDIQIKFTRAVAFVFALLAGLGLYGLVRLNIAGRIREFSIRKALGAGIKDLAYNVFNQYVILACVGVILGAPLGHLLNTSMLSMMYPEPWLGYSGAFISAVILLLVLISVVASQVRMVARSNPVEGLKAE